MARDVRRWRHSGPACSLYPPERGGVTGLAERARTASAGSGLGAQRPLAPLRLRRRLDDGVQLLQPRDAGPLSHVLAGAAQAFDPYRTHDRDHREYRRDHWGSVLRRALATDWPASRDRGGGLA